MKNLSIVAVDLAKQSFQACGTTESGEVLFNRSYSRSKFLKFLIGLPPLTIAMEACGTCHYWARQARQAGHEVKLIAPIYVKPFVRRSKNDANDAEAIATAVRQPGMPFVPPKSEQQQSRAMLFRTHQTLVRQRAQLMTTLRSHLAEFGVIIPKGVNAFAKYEATLEEPSHAELPSLVLELARSYYMQIEHLSSAICVLEKAIDAALSNDEDMVRVMEVPGIGPMTTSAIMAFVPSFETFKKGRDFAAWLGLVPRQFSTGGQSRLGKINKQGQKDVRRLMVVGAMSVIRWGERKGVCPNSWLGKMLLRKPKKVVAVALANKLARTIWAICTKNESYRGSIVQYV